MYARQFADVIAFKVAEQAVLASEEAFRAMVEQTTLGVVRYAFSGRLLFANQRFCEIVGRTAEELHQLRFQEITHPDDLPTQGEIVCAARTRWHAVSNGTTAHSRRWQPGVGGGQRLGVA